MILGVAFIKLAQHGAMVFCYIQKFSAVSQEQWNSQVNNELGND